MKEQLTIEEVARILKVSSSRAYELARTGRIPVVRLGRTVRVDPDQLSEWLARGGSALESNSRS